MDIERMRAMMGVGDSLPRCTRPRDFFLPTQDGRMVPVKVGCQRWRCPACSIVHRASHAAVFAKHVTALPIVYRFTLAGSRWDCVRQRMKRRKCDYAKVRIGPELYTVYTSVQVNMADEEPLSGPAAAEDFARTLCFVHMTGGIREAPVSYSNSWSLGDQGDERWRQPEGDKRPARPRVKKPPVIKTVTHDELCNAAARWLASSRRCVAVTTYQLVCDERPDAIGWTASGRSTLVECKTTRDDYKADMMKPHRQYPELGIGQFRYYLTPPGLITPEELPSGWGLLELRGTKVYILQESKPFQPSFHKERPHLVAIIRYGHNRAGE